MRLIIENLVKNAIEANCSNIIITADISNGQKDSLCQVCFLPVEGEWICVSVKDDGDGILSDVRFDKVFEPFFTMKGVGYAGLGLSQVSGIVKQHKGHIVIQRNPDRGMTFNIYFPI